jgi:hypothetical protein
MEERDELAWRQFCRLGEMIGDGLHYEEPWISKEYKRLAKILLPITEEEKEYKAEIRKIKNSSINKQVAERIKSDRCVCGGELKQARSGSKSVACVSCHKRYIYKAKR